MAGYIIISVFILLLALLVYFEYRNQKKYEEDRRQKRTRVKKENKKPARKHVVEPRKVPSSKELEKKEQEKQKEEKQKEEKRLEEKRLEEKQLTEIKPEPVVSTEKIDLPEADYPKFNHSRLMDMGLSEDEAQEFVAELIPQIETQIPLIKEAMAISDFHEIERLTHSIKGSSTTVGTGGISDLLIDFNTYLKTDPNITVVEAYFEHLKHYYKALKEQYA